MKNSAKKLLALALVLMMTLLSAVIPTSAAIAYDDAEDGDLLYTANFNGDSVLKDVKEAWSGMQTKEVSDGGNTITLKPYKNKSEAAAFGGYLNTDDYPAKGNAYTIVFTVTASDADQEIGLYPDWSTGFVVVPGKDMFKYNRTESDRTKNTTIVDYTEYTGTKELTQTYAIEYKVNDDFSAAEYSLYVAQSGEWVLLYSLNADELDAGPNWSSTDYETVLRFYRDSKIANQSSGTVAVSNVNVYKGLSAKSGAAAAPGDDLPETPDEPVVGNLPYTVNFKGDDVFSGAKGGWSGAEVTTTNTSVTMYTKSDANDANRGSVWGADLKGYTILNKSYTLVFTLTASDADEEIGFLPCDWAGFVITPGQNAYRFITTKFEDGGTDGSYERVIQRGTYEGVKSLTQTYAIELATSGTEDNASVDAYNLYVAQEGEWVLVCALTDIDESIFDWFYFDDGVYEEDYTMRFYRRCFIIDRDGWTTSDLDTDQDGTVTVSDATVYQGLVATDELVEAPDTPVTPVNPGNGNNDNENTGNENAGSENTDTQPNKTDKNETPKDTSAVTDVETGVATDAATDDGVKDVAFGCGGVIGIGSVALLMVSVAGALGMTAKKKED